MTARFAELDWQETPLGAVSLRRRRDPTVGEDVYEVKLDDEYLMSSLFTVAEEALAHRALAALPADATGLRVAVGGLGLGYTARAALADPRVGSLTVVEALAPVLDWHRRGLLPETAAVGGDPRVRTVHGDFFDLLRDGTGPDPGAPGSRVDAVLVDIDHSPRHLLHPGHADAYTVAGLARLAGFLTSRGVFGLWSDDPPDDAFLAALRQVFAGAQAQVVEFPNPHTGGTGANTVYVAGVDDSTPGIIPLRNASTNRW